MSKEITLPSGATVKLRDPSTLKVGDRKRVIKATDKQEGDLSKAMALGDALIAMLIEEWSFNTIIPSIKIENLDDLSMADYDALTEACKDAQGYLFPTLADTEDNSKDPKAPSAS